MEFSNGILDFKYDGASYESGHMQLVLNQFFPTTNTRVRFLMNKIIALNPIERYQIAETILTYLKGAYDPEEYRAAKKDYANAVVSLRTKAGEMQEGIDKQAAKIARMKQYIKELPRGKKKPYQEELQQEKEKLKVLKEKQTNLKRDAQYNNGRFIEVNAKDKRFKENIRIIEELSAGWN